MKTGEQLLKCFSNAGKRRLLNLLHHFPMTPGDLRNVTGLNKDYIQQCLKEFLNAEIIDRIEDSKHKIAIYMCWHHYYEFELIHSTVLIREKTPEEKDKKIKKTVVVPSKMRAISYFIKLDKKSIVEISASYLNFMSIQRKRGLLDKGGETVFEDGHYWIKRKHRSTKKKRIYPFDDLIPKVFKLFEFKDQEFEDDLNFVRRNLPYEKEIKK